MHNAVPHGSIFHLICQLMAQPGLNIAHNDENHQIPMGSRLGAATEGASRSAHCTKGQYPTRGSSDTVQRSCCSPSWLIDVDKVSRVDLPSVKWLAADRLTSVFTLGSSQRLEPRQ
jgi:hypothetical protein